MHTPTPYPSERKQTQAEKRFVEALDRVEQLKEELETVKVSAEEYLSLYSQKIYPSKIKLGLQLIELAVVLELRSHRFNLGRREVNLLSEAVVSILRYASYWVDLTEEGRALWNQYSEQGYHESSPSSNEGEEEDFEGYEPLTESNDTIDYQQIKQNAKEKIEIKKVRAIYIRLAKLLHPDVQDQSKDTKRSEALMKQVTLAYENKDFLTLLHLEMQHIKGSDSVEKSLIKSYTSTLKKQIKSLKNKLKELRSHPRYRLIRKYLDNSTNESIENQINKEITANKKSIKAIIGNLKYIRGTHNKNDFMEMVDILENDFGVKEY